MWFKTQHEALVAGLRLTERKVDPELLAARARELGITLPITCQNNVSAPSLGGVRAMGWQISDYAAFKQAVDAVMRGEIQRGP